MAKSILALAGLFTFIISTGCKNRSANNDIPFTLGKLRGNEGCIIIVAPGQQIRLRAKFRNKGDKKITLSCVPETVWESEDFNNAVADKVISNHSSIPDTLLLRAYFIRNKVPANFKTIQIDDVNSSLQMIHFTDTPLQRLNILKADIMIVVSSDK